jgi:opacity protein-like surface antigen
MMKQLKMAVVMTAAAAGTAQAADDWYLQAHGEFTRMQESRLDVAGAKAGDVEYDLEYAVGLAAGYQPAALPQTRFELEAMYREADFDDLANSTLAPGGFGGSIETYTLMVNGYYDVDMQTAWTPYIGAGIGVAQHEFDSITIQTADEDTVMAGQLMAGLSYTFDDYPVTIGGGYRFYTTQAPDFTDRSGASVEMDQYRSHNIEYFLRWKL